MPSFAVVSSDAVTESTVVRRPIEIPTDTNSRTQIADPSPAAHQNLSKHTFRSSQIPTGVCVELSLHRKVEGLSLDRKVAELSLDRKVEELSLHRNVGDAKSVALSTSMRYMNATRSSMVAAESPVWISNQVQPSVWGVRPGHAEMSIVNKKPPNP